MEVVLGIGVEHGLIEQELQVDQFELELGRASVGTFYGDVLPALETKGAILNHVPDKLDREEEGVVLLGELQLDGAVSIVSVLDQPSHPIAHSRVDLPDGHGAHVDGDVLCVELVVVDGRFVDLAQVRVLGIRV